MKFLCKTEFVHSGVRQYTEGKVYDFDAKTAEQMISLDKKNPIGALDFFTPSDEAAIEFMKSKKCKKETGPAA